MIMFKDSVLIAKVSDIKIIEDCEIIPIDMSYTTNYLDAYNLYKKHFKHSNTMLSMLKEISNDGKYITFVNHMYFECGELVFVTIGELTFAYIKKMYEKHGYLLKADNTTISTPDLSSSEFTDILREAEVIDGLSVIDPIDVFKADHVCKLLKAHKVVQSDVFGLSVDLGSGNLIEPNLMVNGNVYTNHQKTSEQFTIIEYENVFYIIDFYNFNLNAQIIVSLIKEGQYSVIREIIDYVISNEQFLNEHRLNPTLDRIIISLILAARIIPIPLYVLNGLRRKFKMDKAIKRHRYNTNAFLLNGKHLYDHEFINILEIKSWND